MSLSKDQFFTAIYLKRRKCLLEYANSILGNQMLAEDAVQQAFEIGWRKIEDFQCSPNPEGWIFRATSFVVRNMERRLQFEGNRLAQVGDYRPDLVAAPEDPLPLRMHFGSLVDTPQFDIIYKNEICGLTLREIAKDLGISEAACKKRAERARKVLQKMLAKGQI